MPDDDIVTRGDLAKHCTALHKPIETGFADIKGWLDKLDKRQDAAKMLLIGILLTALIGAIANIAVTTMMKVESYESAYRAARSSRVHEKPVYTEADKRSDMDRHSGSR